MHLLFIVRDCANIGVSWVLSDSNVVNAGTWAALSYTSQYWGPFSSTINGTLKTIMTNIWTPIVRTGSMPTLMMLGEMPRDNRLTYLDTSASLTAHASLASGLTSSNSITIRTAGRGVAVIFTSDPTATVVLDSVTVMVSVRRVGSYTLYAQLYNANSSNYAIQYQIGSNTVSTDFYVSGAAINEPFPVTITIPPGSFPLMFGDTYAILFTTDDWYYGAVALIYGNSNIASYGTFNVRAVATQKDWYSWNAPIINPNVIPVVKLTAAQQSIVYADNTGMNTPRWSPRNFHFWKYYWNAQGAVIVFKTGNEADPILS